MQFLQKHLMQSIEIRGLRRKEHWLVPLVALREAVINAIVHADYAQRGSPIRISIFDNRIEIENPGTIPFNMTLEGILQGISKLRNPVVGRVFHEVKLIERWGSGIQRMTAACEAAQLGKPSFEKIGSHFRVTISMHANSKKPSYQLDEVDESILAFLKQGNGCTTQQIADAIGCSSRATRTRLIKLIEKNYVVEIGSGAKDPKRKYHLAAIR